MVKTLLSYADIGVNLGRNPGDTPLYCASENGHEGVVRILLSHADVNPPFGRRQKPKIDFLRAWQTGHEGVIRFLPSQADVNPNLANWYGLTPLSIAANNGHEGVVSVRNGLGARAAPRGNCQEDWTGPDDNFYSVPSWDILGLQG